MSHRERASLNPLRARHWRGRLNESQFAERNRQLYDHPYGASRIHTYGLRKRDRWVSSLDVLEVDLWIGEGRRVLPVSGLLVASVVTEEAERGQGHGGRLLQSLLAGHPDRPMILFSDIAPRYYERFGFELCPVTVVEGPAGGSASCGWPLTVAEFSAWLGERRSRLVRGAGKAATSLLPAPLFLEWKLLRYRHLADVAGSLFPNAHCFACEHDGGLHPLMAAPDYTSDRLEGLWVEPECSACRDRLASLAGLWGVSRWRYWKPGSEPEGGAGEARPMCRIPGRPGVRWLDAQLCDWW